MKRVVMIVGAAGLGAALTYLLDPRLGRRRRARIRDKAARAARRTADAADVTSRDVVNRTRGLVAGIRSRLGGEDVTDEVLIARVRSRLGGAVRRPAGVAVDAVNGCVTLRGTVFSDEAEGLIQRVIGVPGVRSVENRLETERATGDAITRHPAWLPNEWSPPMRLAAGTLGAALAAAGFGQRRPRGLFLAAAGLALFARALGDRELVRALGGREHRPDGGLRKTIDGGQGLAW